MLAETLVVPRIFSDSEPETTLIMLKMKGKEAQELN